jgi:hypothetical protein
MTVHGVSVAGAGRGAKVLWPACNLSRRCQVHIGAKAATEFGQGNAALELDSVEGH